MSHFPISIIPKQLAPETSREVDNSPAIYNARDFNIHLRELIAIEKFLVGDGLGTIDPGSQGIIGLVNSLLQVFANISKNGTIAQYTGLINSGDTVPIPTELVNTHTRDAVGLTDVIIPAVSVTGFPTSGYITRFNSIKTSSGAYTFGKNIRSQEVIRYTGLDTVNKNFTGCVRDPLSAQLVDPAAPALIVSGRASVFLAHKGWTAQQFSTPTQVFLEHDASLVVGAFLYDTGGAPVIDTQEIVYSLTVSGAFEDIKISESV